MFDWDYLRKEQDRKVVQEMIEVSKFNHLTKNLPQIKKGWRFVARVPLAAVMPGVHSEAAKYFDPRADDKERKKDINAFLKRFGEELGC